MLPFDISTALWWTSVPKWEWEALPAPEGEGTTAAEASAVAEAPAGDTAADAAPPARMAAPAAAFAAAGPVNTPPPKPGDERDGYRLVFKGYEISSSVFWYPSDSPLSRPWTAHDATDDHRPRSDDDAADASARAALLRAANDDGAEPT